MKRKSFLSIIPVVLLGSCTNTSLSSSSYVPAYGFQNYFYAFDTTISVRYWCDEDVNLQWEIDPIFDEINKVADPYNRPGKVVSAYSLNHASEPLEVNDTLLELIQASLDAQKKTEGYYNPLVGELTRMWKDSLFGGLYPNPTHVPFVPAQEDVDAALARMNESSIEVNGHMVKINGEGKIDFGGIAKGFALSKVEKFFAAKGITRYLIQASASSLSYGATAKGEEWNVNVDYVDEPFAFKAKDCSSSVSAMYEQYRVIDGVRYSHVINPKTGMATSPYSMACVFGKDAAYLDALSTAAMMADIPTVQKWEQRDDVKVALWTNVPSEDLTQRDQAHLAYATSGFQSNK